MASGSDGASVGKVKATCLQGLTLSQTASLCDCRIDIALILSCMAKHEPDLSLLFHALSDATRRGMLARLAMGPLGASDLAGPTGLRLPTIMRHLGVLEAAGLIVTAKDGRVRSCAFVPAGLAPMQGWLDAQRAVWEGRLDRLDDYVMTLMKETEDGA